MTRNDQRESSPAREHAERIRAALIAAALDGYEQAAMSGLCPDGAWEAAVSAMRMLDLASVLARVDQGADAGETR